MTTDSHLEHGFHDELTVNTHTHTRRTNSRTVLDNNNFMLVKLPIYELRDLQCRVL